MRQCTARPHRNPRELCCPGSEGVYALRGNSISDMGDVGHPPNVPFYLRGHHTHVPRRCHRDGRAISQCAPRIQTREDAPPDGHDAHRGAYPPPALRPRRLSRPGIVPLNTASEVEDADEFQIDPVLLSFSCPGLRVTSPGTDSGPGVVMGMGPRGPCPRRARGPTDPRRRPGTET